MALPPAVSPQAEVELRQNIAKGVASVREGRASSWVTAGSADGQDDDAYVRLRN